MSTKMKTKKLLQASGAEGLTRREFIKKTSLLGVGVAMSPSLFASPAFSSSPKKGGRFIIGLNDFAITDTLDPTLNYTRMQVHLNYQIRNTLIESGPGGKLYPELAESWEATPDAKTWTFLLRKGIEFHNGKPLTADDVVYSYQIHSRPESKSSAKALISSIKEIKAEDKHTVVFELNDGNVDFPFVTTLYSMIIIPAGTTDFGNGIGTGPYILKKFEPGVNSLVTKNPNYFREDKGHFDEVEIKAISDVTARTTALVTGEIHAMSNADLKTINLLEKNKNLKVLRTHGKMHYLFPMRTDTAPFNNQDVRMALKYAIDREQIVKTILHGNGTVGNDHPLNQAYDSYVPGLPQIQYDPDKAKFHLKKAGFENHKFTIHAADTTFTGAVDSALIYQENAKKAGINIEVVREPSDGFWNNVWMKKPWFSSRWSGRPTANLMLSEGYASDASWNETYFKNEKFDKLLKMSRIEFDKAKRSEMYYDMQLIVKEEGGALIPAFADFVDVVSKKVEFGELSSEWELDGSRCAERWWFNS